MRPGTSSEVTPVERDVSAWSILVPTSGVVSAPSVGSDKAVNMGPKVVIGWFLPLCRGDSRDSLDLREGSHDLIGERIRRKMSLLSLILPR